MTILIFIVSLLGAIAIGVPIAWALLLCGISLMFWMDIFDVQILAQTLVNGVLCNCRAFNAPCRR